MAATRLPGLLLALCASSVAASDWPVYGGDAGGRHYSALDQINRDNVAQLEVAWVFRSGDSASFGDEAMAQTSTQSTPILLPEAAGASLVYCTPFNRVIALDPGSGEQRWDFDPQINRGGDRPFRCRGVSYAEDPAVTAGAHCRHRLFLATHDRQLWALDAGDGKPCAGFGDKGRVALYGSSGQPPGEVSNASAPVVANGVVVTGSTVIDFTRATTPRGVVQAFASHSGAPLWQFDPLAGHPDSGSANVWAPMSVDAAHGLVYLPTSAPSPDYYGVARPGDNLYANSVVALDLASGARRWHFQHVRHDLWDYDTPAQPILFDWQRDGVRVPALAQLTKQGFVFVLNRLTGESLWEITGQPVPPSQIPGEVTALTQPKPIAPPPLVDGFLMPNDAWGLTPVDRAHCRRQLEALHNLGLFTPISETLTLMYPGSLGGANWGGGALLADRGVLLVNVNNVAFTGRLLPAAENAAERELPAAGKRFRVTMAGTPWAVEMESLQSFLGLPCNPPPWGKLLAVDLYGGRILWETALGSVHEMGPVKAPFHIEWGTPNLGGGVATAGGLFFIGATMDRQFRAFDTDSGATLWRHTLPVDATATPMTYSYRGRQYLVINAGGHHMFNRGSGDYLYAFGLPQ
ncbi:pyrroloquinoline quinone-dependent dehydrogenase [Haliea sp. E1-2-M8]|uniref:pyrroloquinoline quinone-dependent dehydrogenase n=1 Tax=Haliea sp. E1-2-M8 TaxID=3064706 RepID=UPI00271B9FED|nr:pyrroloquinoline quinone-dependent dehydrogenase [Haliea sp. E1-2-M8]MDO8863319.1 pyrroloquinoline quinone-dependent dehydrogenase [Haliea sp. E1-2-M8]